MIYAYRILIVAIFSIMYNQRGFDLSLYCTDTTKSVIYGTEPAILESDKFSEISLDQSDVDQPFPSSIPTQANRKSTLSFYSSLST